MISFFIFIFLGSFSPDENNAITIDNTSVEFPANWTVQFTESIYLYNVYAPEYAVIGNLLRSELQQEYTFEAYVEVAVSEIRNSLSNFQLIEKQDNYLVFSSTVDSVEVTQIQAYFIRKKEVFILAFSTSKADFDSFKEQLLGIIRSFRFIEPHGE